MQVLASQDAQVRYDRPLQVVFEVQSRIADIHPFLRHVFPVAVVEDNQFLIFDTDASGKRYVFIRRAPTPVPFPRGVRAAFPLESYEGRTACVVTGEVFDSLEGYATVFHEFVHCQQAETCEFRLKQRLGMARRAEAKKDYGWELDYPFPYDALQFAEGYTRFLEALEGDRVDDVGGHREQLRSVLDEGDYEYMVWQEWKEGFARLIENRIRKRLNLEENHRGREVPFDRVLFYEGGARYIEVLAQREPGLEEDIEALFGRMLYA